ncbi:MAG TPA: argininosuccinate lyase [Syntrophorhabdaceae bacterium]|nr:argininosuccinate lyase [Syntrophorhabdaceae bacterium]
MKPWGGRFKGKTNPLFEAFSASIDVDRALYRQDIEGSKVHAEMLEKIGMLTGREKNSIVKGLNEIRKEIETGVFHFDQAREDIHMHIEARLIEKIGDAAKKLHTGRSRNDQVSLDMRLYLKEELANIDKVLLKLLISLVRKAEKEKGVIMPGYTHMQKAQAVPFTHYIMAYYYMFKRDRARLNEAAARIDVLPLGSGALAGSTIPLDRDFVRKKLGFAGVSENSMDTVADRDFVLDALYTAAMVMLHLSRLSEDLILFATEEFSFVALPDELCTGSSLMPHKKNPDALELIRGKTSRVIGDLMSLFSLLKGLPMTYNRDLQEDKEPLFHAVRTIKDAVSIMTLCIDGMTLMKENMRRAAEAGFMPAVEMAEYLTTKGVPFRQAHAIVGKIVSVCETKGKTLAQLSIKELKKHSAAFDTDVFSYMDVANALNKRRTKGAASFKEAARQINEEKSYLNM